MLLVEFSSFTCTCNPSLCTLLFKFLTHFYVLPGLLLCRFLENIHETKHFKVKNDNGWLLPNFVLLFVCTASSNSIASSYLLCFVYSRPKLFIDCNVSGWSTPNSTFRCSRHCSYSGNASSYRAMS